MAKVLLINGSPNEFGCTYTALKELADTLEKHNVETELLYLGKAPMAGCIACGKCSSSGLCVFDDQVNAVLQRLEEYQALVLGSPVYYAGPAGQLCAFLDRLFYASRGRMAGKLGAAVVSCRRGGASAAFDRLNKYFGISNMHVVGSQYWNQVHGFTPEDVRKDGGSADHAYAGAEYGLAAAESGGRQGKRHPPAGIRGSHLHPFHHGLSCPPKPGRKKKGKAGLLPSLRRGRTAFWLSVPVQRNAPSLGEFGVYRFCKRTPLFL